MNLRPLGPQPEDTTAICVPTRPMRPMCPRFGTHRTDPTMRWVPSWYHAHPPDEANRLGRAAVDKDQTAAATERDRSLILVSPLTLHAESSAAHMRGITDVSERGED